MEGACNLVAGRETERGRLRVVGAIMLCLLFCGCADVSEFMGLQWLLWLVI